MLVTGQFRRKLPVDLLQTRLNPRSQTRIGDDMVVDFELLVESKWKLTVVVRLLLPPHCLLLESLLALLGIFSQYGG